MTVGAKLITYTNITSRKIRTEDVYTISGSKIKKVSNEIVQTKKVEIKKGVFEARTIIGYKNGNKTLDYLDKNEWVNFLQALSAIMTTKSTYKNIKKQYLWGKLHQLGKRKLKYIHGVVEKIGNAEPTYPCVQCGIVLPIRLITVDHKFPQSGGGLLAIAEVLRVWGWTEQGAKTTKGKIFTEVKSTYKKVNTDPWTAFQLLPHYYKKFNTNTAVPTMGGLKKSLTKIKPSYELNDKGKAFLSLVIATKGLKDLANACMHSYLNLVPMCMYCNSSKNDSIKAMM